VRRSRWARSIGVRIFSYIEALPRQALRIFDDVRRETTASRAISHPLRCRMLRRTPVRNNGNSMLFFRDTIE